MTLKVIGAGLGRTGTLSLKLALEMLGLGRCHHMGEVFAAPETAKDWVAAADGKPDWERIYDGFGCTTDYPGCNFWRQLMDYYPHAKVLLSVRDPDKWFQSTQTTIFSDQSINGLNASPLKEFFDKAVWAGIKEHIHDRDFMVDYFNRHNAAVESAVPKERLLVFEARQGWEPLCAFLGVPVPEAPYPKVNSSEEFADRSTLARAQTDDGAHNPEAFARAARARLDELKRKHSS